MIFSLIQDLDFYIHNYTCICIFIYVSFINELGELIFYFSLLIIEVFIVIRFRLIRFIE